MTLSRRSFLRGLAALPLVAAFLPKEVPVASPTTIESLTDIIESDYDRVLSAYSMPEFLAITGIEPTEMTSSGIFLGRNNVPRPTAELAISDIYGSYLKFRRHHKGNTLAWRVKPEMTHFKGILDEEGCIKPGGYSCYTRFAIIA